MPYLKGISIFNVNKFLKRFVDREQLFFWLVAYSSYLTPSFLRSLSIYCCLSNLSDVDNMTLEWISRSFFWKGGDISTILSNLPCKWNGLVDLSLKRVGIP